MWNKWEGDDGFGREQIFILSGETAPKVPVYNSKISGVTGITIWNSNDFVPEGWSDVPLTTSGSDNERCCWMATRRFPFNGEDVNNFKGDNYDNAILFSRYSKNGEDGNGIELIEEFYLASNSNSGVTTGTTGWTKTVVTTDKNNRYLWNYEKITYTNNTDHSTIPQVIGTYSEDGVGIKNIKEFYQISDSNTNAPTTWDETTPTLTNEKKYLWNYEEITYSNGQTSETAPVVIGVYGDKGDTGTSGRGISSVTEYYLASDKQTGITITGYTWSTTVTTTDATKKYLWNYEKTTYTDNTTGGTNPVIIGTYGDTGKGISSVTEYYQISSANTVTDLTNNWSTGITKTDSINKYLWNYEVITYTDNTTGGTNPVIIGTHGEKGESAVSYWMEITPNVIKKIGNNFSNPLINISKWKKVGTDSPISITGGIVYLSHETSPQPFTAITGTTYTIPAGFNMNTLTFKWAAGPNSTDAVYDVQTIPILKDGEDGEKGDRGKLLYPAGRWNSGTTYDGTDNEKTPFVTYKNGDEDKYYVLTATTKISGTTYEPNKSGWTEMAQYEALYTKLLVAENGLVGGSVYNGDYVFSKDGVLSGNNTSEYSGFTSEIVDNIFTGDTPNNNFIPNYLVDFNKGRAWFGNGETLINEKGVIHTKNLVEEIKTFILPFRGPITHETNRGLTNPSYNEIEWDSFTQDSGETIYEKVVKDLNVLVIGHEDIA